MNVYVLVATGHVKLVIVVSITAPHETVASIVMRIHIRFEKNVSPTMIFGQSVVIVSVWDF